MKFQLAALLTLGWSMVSPAADRLLEVRNMVPPPAVKTYPSQPENSFLSGVSQKNLLGLTRKSLYSLPERSSLPSQVVNLRILSVRVDFQLESPDDPTTTGNGKFDFRSFDQFYVDEQHQIDPAPHNKAFFEAHLSALNNYWGTVSDSHLTLQYDVYPPDSDSAYHLPHSMAYYGQQNPVNGLSEFFTDTWQLVDATEPGLDFSQYQAFAVFHAGSDRQSDLPFSATPTPNDLFTGFIVMGQPVAVDGGAFEIGEGLIIPETVSQDTRIGALNGVMAHEFGHQLGLVDLYKTSTFTTQIGDFSLMDNNAAGVGVDLGFRGPAFGVLPVYPDAWSRAYLGMDVPVEIQNQQDAEVFAAELKTDSTQIIKIPINSQEYFLLENRYQDLDKSGRTDLKADSATGVIQGPGKILKGAPVLTREYDALLPGSGMLIWHIDEGVAYLDYTNSGLNNFIMNTLQWDKDRRFVELMEADGIIDFGGNYYTGYGRPEDMYYRENNSAFTPTTYPSSRSNTGAETHIRVTGITSRDTLMQCDIVVSTYWAGWPQRFKPASNSSSLVAADGDADLSPELFLSSGNKVYCWKQDGSKFIPNSDLDSSLIYDGDSLTVFPVAVFAQTDTDLVGAPAVADLDGDGIVEVIAGTASGNLYVWQCQDLNTDGRADLLPGFPLDLNCSGLAHQPVIGNFIRAADSLEILAFCTDGQEYVIEISASVTSNSFPLQISHGVALSGEDRAYYVVQEGSLLLLSRIADSTSNNWSQFLADSDNFPPVVGDLNRDGREDVTVISRNGTITVYNDSTGNPVSGYPLNIGEEITSKPVLGDLDTDGFLEIIFGGDNKLWALNYNGTVCTNFPKIISSSAPAGDITSAPLLIDVNGDSRSDLIAGSPAREILGYSGLGARLGTFPLSAASAVATAGTIVSFDPPTQNSQRQLAYSATDGFVYVWNLTGNFANAQDYWLSENFDSRHSNYLPFSALPSPPVAGVDIMPQSRFYSYPNPAINSAIVRYYLNYDSDVEIKFFDLSGNLLQTHRQNGLAFTDNEFEWDCSGLASGVYICKVEARSQGRSQTEFCKIALVK